MLTYGPQIMLSFAVDESTSCGSPHYESQPQLSEAQRLKAIESYALIAASHAVSVQPVTNECETTCHGRNAPTPQSRRNQSSLGLSMRLQDTFRNYLRMRVPNQISFVPPAERHRPSQELRQMFTDHLSER